MYNKDPTYNENITNVYSAVTFAAAWPRVGRLIVLVMFSCFGTIMNGFFVASFFVETNLRRLGNVFLACVGITDLIVTAGLMPIPGVVLLSGEGDTEEVCHVIQFLAETATYCYSMFFMLVALECYFRICRPVQEYNYFMNMRVPLICLMVFVVGFALAGAGVYMELDYDYCKRRHHGNLTYRYITMAIFFVIPFIITTYTLISSGVHLRYRNDQQHPQYRRSMQFVNENSALNVNLLTYFMFAIFWLPFLIVTMEYPTTANYKFYHTAWLGVFRCVIATIFYGTVNRIFRSTFGHLFNYCCCKSNLRVPVYRQRRADVEHQCTTGDMRLYFMHHLRVSHLRSGSTVSPLQDQIQL